MIQQGNKNQKISHVVIMIFDLCRDIVLCKPLQNVDIFIFIHCVSFRVGSWVIFLFWVWGVA